MKKILSAILLMFLSLSVFAADLNTSVNKQDYARRVYIMQVQKIIEFSLKQNSIKIPSKMILDGVFTQDGKMQDIQIIESSGDKDFDNKIVQLVNNFGTFGEAPKEEPLNNRFKIYLYKAPPYSAKDNYVIFYPYVAAKNEIDWEPYLAGIQKSIKKNWQPPRYTAAIKTDAEAYFNVLKDGTIENIHIIKSSGDKDFDLRAIDALLKTSPYKPLPKDFTGRSVCIEFTFRFNQRVGFTNGGQVSLQKTKKPQKPANSLQDEEIFTYDDNAPKEYELKIHNKIENSLKKYNIIIRRSVILEGNFTKDGRFTDIKVTKSSGSDIIDYKIAKIIQSLESFGEAPKGDFVPDTFKISLYKAPPYSYEDNLVILKLSNKKLAKTNYDKIDWTPYMAKMKKTIKKDWEGPGYYSQEKSVKAVTVFDILKDGTIDNIHIIKSSGDENFDDSAIESLLNISPLEPLPKEYTGESINVQYIFEQKKPFLY